MRHASRQLVAAAAVFLFSVSGAAAQASPEASQGAAVVLGRDTLFTLYAPIGAFSAADRAEGVVRRAGPLARAVARGLDSIVIVEGETHTDLVVGEVVLMTVLDGDAAPLNQARGPLALQYAQRLQGGMTAEASRTSLKTLAFGALFAVLATVALILLIKGLGLAVPRILARVEGWRGTVIPALRIQ